MAFNCLQLDLCEIFVFGKLDHSIYFQKFLEQFSEMTGGTTDMMSNWPTVWPNVNVMHYLFQPFPDKNTCKTMNIDILRDIGL